MGNKDFLTQAISVTSGLRGVVSGPIAFNAGEESTRLKRIQPERFKKAVEAIHAAADKACSSYDKLVRTARKKFLS